MKNCFVIGDVHGCYHTLMALVKQFPKDAKLIFVGDLCDKGEYSKDVIEFVMKNNHLCVKGNHEHLYEKYILDAVLKDIHSPWSDDKRYGGKSCIDSYGGDIALIKKHLEWIKKLPMYIEIDKFFITHGFALELYKHKDDKNYYNDFLLNRYYEDSIEPEVEEDIINIFGHCIFDDVKVGKKFVCLDTGCSGGGHLSAISLDSMKIYKQKMDERDSSYQIKELTLELFDKQSTLEDIKNITLKSGCRYSEYDVISHDVLVFILERFGDDGLEQIKEMQKKSVIFHKQLNRVLEVYT